MIADKDVFGMLLGQQLSEIFGLYSLNHYVVKQKLDVTDNCRTTKQTCEDVGQWTYSGAM